MEKRLPPLKSSSRPGYIYISTDVHMMPEVWSMPSAAFVKWIYGLCWASQFRHETEWTIPHDVADTFTTRKERQALLDAGFWIDRGLWYELPRKNRRQCDLWKPGASGLRRVPIPRRIRELVYERDGRRCLACGSIDFLTLDHIKHWSRGGSDSPSNLRTLCRSCNSKRRTKTDEEWLGRAL
jgi:5-methylcytosine-specific restriction endonuclease McrA